MKQPQERFIPMIEVGYEGEWPIESDGGGGYKPADTDRIQSYPTFAEAQVIASRADKGTASDVAGTVWTILV